MPKLQPNLEVDAQLTALITLATNDTQGVNKDSIKARDLFIEFSRQLNLILEAWNNTSIEEKAKQFTSLGKKMSEIRGIETKSVECLNAHISALQGYSNQYEWPSDTVKVITQAVSTVRLYLDRPPIIAKFTSSSLEVCKELRALFSPAANDVPNATNIAIQKVRDLVTQAVNFASKGGFYGDGKQGGAPLLKPSVDNYKQLNTFVDTAFGNVTDVYKKGIEASKLYDDFVSQLRTMLDSWKANPSMDEMTRQLGLVVLKVLAISKVETKSSATLNEDGEALQGYLNKFEWHKKSLTTSLTNTINETKKLAGWPAQIQRFKTSSLEICQKLRSLFNPGQGNGADTTKDVMQKIAKILQETSEVASKSGIVQDEKLNGYLNPPAFNPELEEQKQAPMPVLVASPTISPKKPGDDSPSHLSHNKDGSNSNSRNDSPNHHSPVSQKGLFSPAGIYMDAPPPSFEDAKNDPVFIPLDKVGPLAPLTASQVNANNGRASQPLAPKSQPQYMPNPAAINPAVPVQQQPVKQQAPILFPSKPQTWYLEQLKTLESDFKKLKKEINIASKRYIASKADPMYEEQVDVLYEKRKTLTTQYNTYVLEANARFRSGSDKQKLPTFYSKFPDELKHEQESKCVIM